ncbi:MAG: hypothetical protein Q7T73_21615 [Beijerinckiaceae bacterium]|nr:hypothetical protein [Beijerinckiaceae bacterium]
MTLKNESFSAATLVVPSKNQAMQLRKRGPAPKPIIEFPEAIISTEWQNLSLGLRIEL